MGKVYASSDWHGCSAVGNKILDYLQPDDILYFLGDSIDRGRYGAELFKRLISDKRVIYIKGNHEQMMEDALPFLWDDYRDMTWVANYQKNKVVDLWFCNGGNYTWYAIEEEPKKQLIRYYNILKNMPLKQEYLSPKGHKVILEHAGYTPFDVPHRSHDPLWDREHFLDPWTLYDNNPEAKNTYLVHGHTPVQYLLFNFGYKGQPPITKELIETRHKWLYGTDEESKKVYDPYILRYCDGHKFDIDLCTVIHHKAALLDLDDLSMSIYFEAEDPKSEEED